MAVVATQHFAAICVHYLYGKVPPAAMGIVTACVMQWRCSWTSSMNKTLETDLILLCSYYIKSVQKKKTFSFSIFYDFCYAKIKINSMVYSSQES